MNNPLKKLQEIKMSVDISLRRAAPYLKEGRYRMSPALDMLYLESAGEEAGAERAFLYRNVTRKPTLPARAFTLVSAWSVDGGGDIFNGRLLIPGTNGKDIKVIDPEAGRLLTICADGARREELLEKRGLWGRYFRVVEAERLPATENAFVEMFVPKQTFDPEAGLRQIFRDYAVYLGGFFSGHPDSKSCAEMSEPCCLTHGDLWSSNLIFDGKCFYYIDFEHVKRRYFLFDVLYYIFAEGFVKGNDEMMRSFLKGRYDEEFAALFSGFGGEYRAGEKAAYFERFLAELYADRWKGRAKKETLVRCREYMREFFPGMRLPF